MERKLTNHNNITHSKNSNHSNYNLKTIAFQQCEFKSLHDSNNKVNKEKFMSSSLCTKLMLYETRGIFKPSVQTLTCSSSLCTFILQITIPQIKETRIS